MRHLRAALVVGIAVGAMVGSDAWAHCDSLDGPVIRDARLALEKQDPAPVLKWVRQADENEVREAFKQTIEVRKSGAAAKELADRFFFETLVRIHRAGEGEEFTGLKPAGEVEAGIVAADHALESGSVTHLADEVAAEVREGIRKRFDRVLEERRRAAPDVKAGREFVAAYVDYIHFVENMHKLTSAKGHHHH